MTFGVSLRSLRPRVWLLWQQKWWLASYLLLIDIGSLVVPIVWTGSVRAADWWRLLGLIVLGVGITEASRRTERVRRMLSSTTSTHVDLTSVWTISGVLLLPVQLLLPLVVVLYTHLAFRSWRHLLGAVPHRVVGTAAVAALNAYLVYAVLDAGGWPGIAHPGRITFTDSLLLLIALLVHFVVGTLMVLPSYLGRGESARSVFGSWFDHGLELATDGLGVLVAITFVVMPLFLAVFVPVLLLIQRSSLAADLETPAVTDAKTGLHNIDAWRRLAETTLAQAERDETPVSLLLIDLDRFKSVNDTHGHLVGDTVLRAVADTLGTTVRTYDITGRFGGEEFVALLPNTANNVAASVAERIRAGVENLQVTTGNEYTLSGLSVSIGISAYSPDAATVDALLAAADIALYAAKSGGRNRIEVAGNLASAGSQRAHWPAVTQLTVTSKP